MADKTTEQIIDKIAKLLELSRGRGTTTHEASTAAALAQGLMDRYRLDMATIDRLHATAEDVVCVSDEPLDQMGRPVGWKMSMGAELAALNSCRLVALPSLRRAGAAKLLLIGVGTDTQVVRYLYTYLRREINRLAQSSVRSMRRKRAWWPRQESTLWGTSFRLGAVSEVVRRLRLVKQNERDATAAAGHSTAIVLLDTHEKRVLSFCDVFVRGEGAYGKPPEGFRQDLSAHVAGRRAASTIDIPTALPADGSNPAINKHGS